MKAFAVTVLGVAAVAAALWSLRVWTLGVTLPGRPRSIELLVASSSGAGVTFVVMVATAGMLAEAAVLTRRPVLRRLAVASLGAVLVAWLALLAAQTDRLAQLAERARPWVGRCESAGPYCPRLGVGDGPAYARLALILILVAVLLLVVRWGWALLGGAFLAVVFVGAPHVIGLAVTADTVSPVWHTSSSALIGSGLLMAGLVLWGRFLWDRPRGWWVIVMIAIWVASLAAIGLLSDDRASMEAALVRAEGLAMTADYDWALPSVFVVLGLPVAYVISWWTDRRPRPVEGIR